MTDFVKIVEVGPRDGLQNHVRDFSVSERIDFINRLNDTGLSVIEVGALVSPKWVPKMAGSDEVFTQIKKRDHVSYPMLVPNEKGLDRAIETGVNEIAIFVAASETFSQKNINKSIAESLDLMNDLVPKALDAGMKVRGYVSCVMGCPYEGHIEPQKVIDVSKALDEMGCYEISLGDTIGVGTPYQARDLIRLLKEEIDVSKLALHFHDTYGQALVNIFACLEEGVHIVDSAIGGLGGCPYAKGASGNVATEKVLYMLEGMGIKTGVDREKILEIADWVKAL